MSNNYSNIPEEYLVKHGYNKNDNNQQSFHIEVPTTTLNNSVCIYIKAAQQHTIFPSSPHNTVS